ncbi:MAG: glycosyltransferase [Elusimicrobiota bacterium]
MIKILFILDCLDPGGAQRAVINILNNIDKEKFSPHLVLIKGGGKIKQSLSNDIPIHELNFNRVRFSFIKLARFIKKASPDIILSTPTYISVLVYIARKYMFNLPDWIIRCPTIESISLKTVDSFFTRIFARKAYKSANKVVIMTEEMRKDLIENFKLSDKKFVSIPNPVDVDSIEKQSIQEVKHVWLRKDRKIPVIISMGRLDPAKGYEILLKAFCEFRKKKDAKLIILGEGKLRKKLRKLAFNLGIEKDVDFAGVKKNPYSYIAKSDLFVLSSLWEGFPNALVEAMACKVPVIASNCQSGPSEIITNGENGILVSPGDPMELSKAMNKVFEKPDYRERLVLNGFNRAKDYEAKKVTKKYEKLFKSF